SRNAVENPATRTKTEELERVARAGWVEIARIHGGDHGIFARFDPAIYYAPPRRAPPLRRLATITDPIDDVAWSRTAPRGVFVPDVIEASVAIEPERQMVEFAWTFSHPLPRSATRDLELVCLWRLAMAGSDPAGAAADFLVRLGWYADAVTLFVDDGRAG